ncbi:MAG: hypothetical protein HN431_03065 [Bacteroidetes bacterium]|nr:hypothetical protein [Bacteroidota bacterium]
MPKIKVNQIIGVILLVTIISAQDLIIDGEEVYMGGEYQYENVTIINNGTIRLTEYGGTQENQGKMILICDTLYIDETSLINSNGAGGHYGIGAGGDGEYGNGSGAYAGGGGGGHAGDGGYGGGDIPGGGGITYGTHFELTRGSSGGARYSESDSNNGKGGGAIRIVASYAQINGNIEANGTPGLGSSGSGGGSGGMIWLEIDEINLIGNIKANGENGAPGATSNSYGSGGGGGGGRITIVTESDIEMTQLAVYGGVGGDSGNGYAGLSGTNGSILYMKNWITSNTHPNEEKWYINPTPEIEFDAQGNIYGYLYTIDQNPDGIADQASEFTQQNALTIETLSDGEWYFHGVPMNDNYELLESQHMTYQLNVQNGPLMISSPTHPQENYSYNSSNPVFNIETVEGINNYIYILDQNEGTIPNLETGIYLENPSLIIPGVPNGTHWLHAVGVDEVGYVGDQTSHFKINIGICEEEVIIDDCGECNGNNETLDCNGDCNGEAYLDNCEECVGGNTGYEAGWTYDDCYVCNGNNENMDCMGICFGDAESDIYGECCQINNIDDCGVCNGGNQEMDCTNTCNGTAYIDECGTCDDNPNNDNILCTGCTDPEAINYNPDAIIMDESCEYLEIGIYIPTISASPGDTVQLTIQIEIPNENTIISGELEITCPTNAISIENVEISEELGNQGWLLEASLGDCPIPVWLAGGIPVSGPQGFIVLEIIISENAIAEYIPIEISNLMFDETTYDITITGGGINTVIPNYGDVSMNGEITSYDAGLILQYLLETIPFTFQQELNAEVSGDLTITAYDASLILQYGVGLIGEFPAETGQQTIWASGEFNTEDDVIENNTNVSIPLYLENGTNIYSFEMQIQYNENDLIFIGVESGANIEGFTILSNEENGNIKIVGASAYPDGQDGVFLSINFSVNEIFAENYTDVSILEIQLNEEIPETEIDNTRLYNLEYYAGDLNLDEQINVLDVVIEVGIILGEVEPTAIQLQTGDISGDGQIDVLDIVILVDQILAEQ